MCLNLARIHRKLTLIFCCSITPTIRSGAQPLVEREKQFECRSVKDNAFSLLHVWGAKNDK